MEDENASRLWCLDHLKPVTFFFNISPQGPIFSFLLIRFFLYVDFLLNSADFDRAREHKIVITFTWVLIVIFSAFDLAIGRIPIYLYPETGGGAPTSPQDPPPAAPGVKGSRPSRAAQPPHPSPYAPRPPSQSHPMSDAPALPTDYAEPNTMVSFNESLPARGPAGGFAVLPLPQTTFNVPRPPEVADSLPVLLIICSGLYL